MTVLQGAYPDNISKEIKDLLDHFYDRSNASSAHHKDEGDEEYFASLFAEDGVYDFMGNEAKGRPAIVKLRKSMFEKVPHRDHRVVKFFTHGSGDNELMCLGEVDYKHHSGKDHWQPWAGRYITEKTPDGLKFKLVQIMAKTDQQEGHR